MKQLAWAVLSLGLLAAVPATLTAQDGSADSVQLGQNYPNPFNATTTIPFELGEDWFVDGHRPAVSLRIYNVLAQLVAIPILKGSEETLNELGLSWNGSGRFEAYWDGRYGGTGRVAASGVYVYQLVVDRERVLSKRMSVIR